MARRSAPYGCRSILVSVPDYLSRITENVIVGDEIAQGRRDEEIFLPPFLSPEHVSLRAVRDAPMIPSSPAGRSVFRQSHCPYLSGLANPPQF